MRYKVALELAKSLTGKGVLSLGFPGPRDFADKRGTPLVQIDPSVTSYAEMR